MTEDMSHVGRGALHRRLLVTLLLVLTYFFPSLLTAALSLFACYRIDRLTAGLFYSQNYRVRAQLLSCTVTAHPSHARAVLKCACLASPGLNLCPIIWLQLGRAA